MENKTQRYRYFKDSETDKGWLKSGVLYARIDVEEGTVYYARRDGSRGAPIKLGDWEHVVNEWLKGDKAIEIPESEAVLIS